MCFDPASLGIAAVGSALSGYGQMRNNAAAMKNYRADSNAHVQQMWQDVAEAQLRNKILNEYTDRQKGYVEQNKGVLSGATQQFAAPQQQAALDNAGAARTSAAVDAIGAPQANVATRDDASPLVQGEIAKRMGAAYDRVRGNATAGAKLAAYGDTWDTGNKTALQDSARKIDTTNSMARGDISTLQADQDLQAFQMRQPIYSTHVRTNPGSAYQGLGSLIGSLAGAYGNRVPGYLSSAYSYFGG